MSVLPEYKPLEASIMMPPEVKETEPLQPPDNNTYSGRMPLTEYTLPPDTTSITKSLVNQPTPPKTSIFEDFVNLFKPDDSGYRQKIEELMNAQQQNKNNKAIDEYFKTHYLDKDLVARSQTPTEYMTQRDKSLQSPKPGPLKYGKFNAEDVYNAILNDDAILDKETGNIYRRKDGGIENIPIAFIDNKGNIKQKEYTETILQAQSPAVKWGIRSAALVSGGLATILEQTLPVQNISDEKFTRLATGPPSMGLEAFEQGLDAAYTQGTAPITPKINTSDMSLTTPATNVSNIESPDVATGATLINNVAPMFAGGLGAAGLAKGAGKLGTALISGGVMSGLGLPNRVVNNAVMDQPLGNLAIDEGVNFFTNVLTAGIVPGMRIKDGLKPVWEAIKPALAAQAGEMSVALGTTALSVVIDEGGKANNYDENGKFKMSSLTAPMKMSLGITGALSALFGFKHIVDFRNESKQFKGNAYKLFDGALQGVQEVRQNKLQNVIGENADPKITEISDLEVEGIVKKMDDAGLLEPNKYMNKAQMKASAMKLVRETHQSLTENNVPTQTRLSINKDGIFTINQKMPVVAKPKPLPTVDEVELNNFKNMVETVKSSPIADDKKNYKVLESYGLFPTIGKTKDVDYAQTMPKYYKLYDALTGSTNGVDPLTGEVASPKTRFNIVNDAIINGNNGYSFNFRPSWMADETDTPFMTTLGNSKSILDYDSTEELQIAKMKVNAEAGSLLDWAGTILQNTADAGSGSSRNTDKMVLQVLGAKDRQGAIKNLIDAKTDGENFKTYFDEQWKKSKWGEVPLQWEMRNPPNLRLGPSLDAGKWKSEWGPVPEWFNAEWGYKTPPERKASNIPLSKEEQDLIALKDFLANRKYVKGLLVGKYEGEGFKLHAESYDAKIKKAFAEDQNLIDDYNYATKILDGYLERHPNSKEEIKGLIVSEEDAKKVITDKVAEDEYIQSQLKREQYMQEHVDKQLMGIMDDAVTNAKHEKALKQLLDNELTELLTRPEDIADPELMNLKAVAKIIEHNVQENILPPALTANNMLSLKQKYDRWKGTKSGEIIKGIAKGTTRSLALSFVIPVVSEANDGTEYDTNSFLRNLFYAGLIGFGGFLTYRKLKRSTLMSKLTMNKFEFNDENIEPTAEKTGVLFNSILTPNLASPSQFLQDKITLNAKLKSLPSIFSVSAVGKWQQIKGNPLNDISITYDILNPYTGTTETVTNSFGPLKIDYARQRANLLAADFKRNIDNATIQFKLDYSDEDIAVMSAAKLLMYSDLNETFQLKKAGKLSGEQYIGKLDDIKNNSIDYVIESMNLVLPKKYNNSSLIEGDAIRLNNGLPVYNNIQKLKTEYTAATTFFEHTDGNLPVDIPQLKATIAEQSARLKYKKDYGYDLANEDLINMFFIKDLQKAIDDYSSHVAHSEELLYMGKMDRYKNTNDYPWGLKVVEYAIGENGIITEDKLGVRMINYHKGYKTMMNSIDETKTKLNAERYYDKYGNPTDYYTVDKTNQKGQVINENGEVVTKENGLTPSRVLISFEQKDFKLAQAANRQTLQGIITEIMQTITSKNISKERLEGMIERIDSFVKNNDDGFESDEVDTSIHIKDELKNFQSSLDSQDKDVFRNAMYDLIHLVSHTPWNPWTPSRNYYGGDLADLSYNNMKSYLDETNVIVNNKNKSKLEYQAQLNEIDEQIKNLITVGMDNKYLDALYKYRKTITAKHQGLENTEIFDVTFKKEKIWNNIWNMSSFMYLSFNPNTYIRNRADAIRAYSGSMALGESFGRATIDGLKAAYYAQKTEGEAIAKSLIKFAPLTKNAKRQYQLASGIINLDNLEDLEYVHTKIESGIYESVVSKLTRDKVSKFVDAGYANIRFSDFNNRVFAADIYFDKWIRDNPMPIGYDRNKWYDQGIVESLSYANNINGGFEPIDLPPFLSGVRHNSILSKFFTMMGPYTRALENHVLKLNAAVNGNNEMAYNSAKSLLVESVLGTVMVGIGSTFGIGDSYFLTQKLSGTSGLDNNLTPKKSEVTWNEIKNQIKISADALGIPYSEEAFNKTRSIFEYGIISHTLERNVSVGTGMFDILSPFAWSVTTQLKDKATQAMKDEGVLALMEAIATEGLIKGEYRNIYRTLYMGIYGTLPLGNFKSNLDEPFTTYDYVMQFIFGDPLDAVKERTRNVLSLNYAESAIEKERFIGKMLDNNVFDIEYAGKFRQSELKNRLAGDTSSVLFKQSPQICNNYLNTMTHDDKFMDGLVKSTDSTMIFINDNKAIIEDLSRNGEINETYLNKPELIEAKLKKIAIDYYTGYAALGVIKDYPITDSLGVSVKITNKYPNLDKIPFADRGYELMKIKFNEMVTKKNNPFKKDKIKKAKVKSEDGGEMELNEPIFNEGE